MLGSVARKELIRDKLTVPPIKTTLEDFSPYEYPQIIGGNLADR